MTEVEWRACTKPEAMLNHLRGCKADRKLRLFAVACCRAVWSMLRNEKKENAVEIAERYADGLVGDSELKLAAEAAWESGKPLYLPAKSLVKATTTKSALAGAEFAVQAWLGVKSEERNHADQCELLRCIFGNRFRPIPLDPAWLAWKGGMIPNLARGIYDKRAFDRLPTLADGLEQAGCDHADILAHCRRPGLHARGCWVVDLLLCKT